MQIKSINTKHVTESPFVGLVETIGEFEPYYICEIITDNGREHGKGNTAEDAERAALEMVKFREAQKVDVAYGAYLAEQGVYFVDF